MSILLVLGGAKSGKSDYALEHANKAMEQKIYIATATPLDSEMQDKIDAHKNQRDDTWTTIDAPMNLKKAIVDNASNDSVLLVDCLTMWLSNLLCNNADINKEIYDLLETVKTINSSLIFVSNEVGMGLVPDNKMGRDFRNYQGTLNKELATLSDTAVFVVSGLPLALKGSV